MKTATFRGGVHPLHRIHHGKGLSDHAPIRVMPPPAQVVLPMSQSAGTTCDPLVQKGDRVLRGQKIGEPRGYVGAPVYASVSGTVLAVEQREVLGGNFSQCVVIENDGQDECAPPLEKLSLNSRAEDLLTAVREAGLVGMGGAAFPTQVKLSPPKGKEIDTILINGAECEPYLTCDHRIMLEHPEEVVMGARLAMRITGAMRGVIGVEANKPDAIAALAKVASGTGVMVLPLKVKYPQGSEKQLIAAATGRQVPSGGLPADVGCVVINSTTAYTMTRALVHGEPLMERVVTVTGIVREPSNVLVRLGTSIQEVVDFCGGFTGPVERLLSGGPMMGIAIYDLSAPVVKTTGGLLALDEKSVGAGKQTPCIRCGRCASACPMRLMPMEIRMAVEKQDWARAEKANALDCMECGSCTYSCPAKLDILTNIRVGKRVLIANRKK